MGQVIRVADSSDAERVEAFLLSIAEFDGTVVEGVERQEWRWLFSAPDGPVGACVAEDAASGEVVGHYGLARLPYVVDGVTVESGLLCKLAVKPELRRTPLFVRLSSEVLSVRFPAQERIAFSYGLVNRPGLLQFHQAFGLRAVGYVPVYAKPMRPERIASAVLGPQAYRLARPLLDVSGSAARWVMQLNARRPSRDVQIRQVTDLARELRGAEGFLDGFRYHALRTGDAIAHRFEELPLRAYLAYRVDGPLGYAGYFIVRRMQMQHLDVLALVDVCLDPRQSMVTSVVMRHIDRLAIEAGVDVISVLPGSRQLRRILRRHLYFASPERFALMIKAGHASLGSGPLPATSRDWYVTWFDHDYV